MSSKIAAVVVTFNRLELLKQCIDSLRNQTHKLDEIIIVNNSSTDGTIEWLNQQKDLTIITQENSGSAGGQHTGIKIAYEKGFDWIWCFDDDCFVETNALEELVAQKIKGVEVLNSLVLSKENPEKFAFGMFDKTKNKVFRKLSDIDDQIIPSANFFNGTLLNRNVIFKVGLPLKFLFIRGEEYEYFIRIQESGLPIFTITTSIVKHPSAIKKIYDNRLFRYEFLFLDFTKRYYTIRNLTYITKKYQSQKKLRLLKIIFFDLLVLLVNLKIKLIFSELKGLRDGLILIKNYRSTL